MSSHDHEHDENCDHDHGGSEGAQEGHDHGPAVDPAVYEGLEGWKVQETSQATRELVACVPWQTYLELRTQATKKLAKQVTVPGFRKGKVPPSRVLALHGDEVRREAQDQLIQQVWDEAREEGKLKPVGNPAVVDLKFEEGEPLRFVARFEILPELELAGLDDLKIDDKVVKVTDEDVEEEIQRLREARAEVIDSDKEELSPGDLAQVTLHRFAPGADPASAEPEDTSEDVVIEVGSERNPPELDKALLGLGVGEMRTFTSSTQGEGEENVEVPGRVLLKGVKLRSLPDVTDDFVKGLGLGPETVDAMKTEIRSRLTTGRTDKARSEQDDQAVQHLLERNPVEMPKALVEHEAESRIRRGMENLARQGVDLKTIEVDWAAEFERARSSAEKALRADYLLELAADARSIEVTEEDLNQALEDEAERLGTAAKQLRAEIVKSNRMNEFRQTVRRRLTLDKLRAGATVSVE
jgi:trigger factor